MFRCSKVCERYAVYGYGWRMYVFFKGLNSPGQLNTRTRAQDYSLLCLMDITELETTSLSRTKEPSTVNKQEHSLR